MANNPSTLPGYNGQTAAPDANYTYGSARNDVAPGDLTGTPRISAEINDILGFQQALLNGGGIVPSGNPDTVIASQYLAAMQIINGPVFTNIANLKTQTTLVGNVLDLSTLIGAKVFWQGYYTAGDGGGNTGVVKSGAHTGDDGSIISLGASTFVQADIRNDNVSSALWGVTESTGSGTDANFDAWLAFIESTVEAFGSAGSTVGQPENLDFACTATMPTGKYKFDGDWYIPGWVKFDGNGSVLDLTNAISIQWANAWTFTDRINIIATSKRTGVTWEDKVGTNTTDVALSVFNRCLFRGFNWVFSETNNPHKLLLKDCRSIACHQLFNECDADGIVIDGGSYTAEFTDNNLPYIKNSGGMTITGNAVFTPVDDLQFNPTPPTTIPRTTYRWFDNHRRLTIDSGVRFGNELVNRTGIENPDNGTPQVALCHNFADASDSTTIITGSKLNANTMDSALIVRDVLGFFRNTAAIELFGMPATLIVKGMVGFIGGIYSTTAPSDKDITTTSSNGGGLFNIQPALATKLENNTLQIRRYLRYDVDNNSDLPLLSGSFRNTSPLLDQLKRDSTGLAVSLFPSSVTAGKADFFILTDILPDSWVMEVHFKARKTKAISFVGYRIEKKIFDDGGVETSQLLSTELYTRDFVGAITIGHNNTTTVNSTNLNPNFIGIAITDADAVKFNNSLEIKLLSR